MIIYDHHKARKGLDFLNHETYQTKFSLERSDLGKNSEVYRAISLSEEAIASRIASYQFLNSEYQDAMALIFTRSKKESPPSRKQRNIYQEIFGENENDEAEVDEATEEAEVDEATKEAEVNEATEESEVDEVTEEAEAEKPRETKKEQFQKMILKKMKKSKKEELQEMIFLNLQISLPMFQDLQKESSIELSNLSS